MNYLKMPWSIEDTIDNLRILKKAFQAKVININQDGIGEQDAEEVAFDFDRAINALQENYEYHNTGLTPKQVAEMICELSATKRVLEHYRKLGTLEEVRAAVEKQRAKKPIYRHYENAGEPPYIKIACPNGCRIQLHPVTDKHLAHEHDYCPKCGQRIDWSEGE